MTKEELIEATVMFKHNLKKYSRLAPQWGDGEYCMICGFEPDSMIEYLNRLEDAAKKKLLLSMPLEEKPFVDYPEGVTGDAWSYGIDEGYNIAIGELKEWRDKQLKELKCIEY